MVGFAQVKWPGCSVELTLSSVTPTVRFCAKAIRLPNGIESYPDMPVSSASRMIVVHCMCTMYERCDFPSIVRAITEQACTNDQAMSEQWKSDEYELFHIIYILIRKSPDSALRASLWRVSSIGPPVASLVFFA